jgi:hypothetical protein
MVETPKSITDSITRPDNAMAHCDVGSTLQAVCCGRRVIVRRLLRKSTRPTGSPRTNLQSATFTMI